MDKRLKQRLLGAAVIVALAVIFVPELVKQTPSQDPAQNSFKTTEEIPPQPPALATLAKGSVKLPSQAASTSTSMSTSTSTSMPMPMPNDVAADDDNALQNNGNENDSSQSIPVAEEVSDTTSAQALANEKKEARRLKEQEEHRRLERQKAEQAAKRLAAIEVETKTKTADTQAKTQKKTAKTTAAKAESNAKSPSLPKLQLISPSLYQKKPAKNAPNRWVVQAGSFADSQNAKLLRERLRTLQFQVSMNQATVNGETRYRVQLGPHVSRAESERIRDRLLREAGIPSSVVPIYN